MTRDVKTRSRKERPILMSAPMVRAILDGSKTQTRRWLMDFKLPEGLEQYETAEMRLVDGFLQGRKNETEEFCQLVHGQGKAPDCAGIPTRCPYGQPGDSLWVKETFMPMPHLNAKAFYRATDPLVGGKWKPSIFMPRTLSRITLEITGVRVERLHEISEADAKAEGAPWLLVPLKDDGYIPDTITHHGHRMGYAALWESINGKGSWNLNPWVWVIEFRRL